MANLWYGIPKLTTVDRGTGDEPAVSIIQGLGELKLKTAMGIDGGLTLSEVQDLQWRLQQATQLLKSGKIRRQKA